MCTLNTVPEMLFYKIISLCTKCCLCDSLQKEMYCTSHHIIFHIPRPVNNVCTLYLKVYGIKTQNRWFEIRNNSSFYSVIVEDKRFLEFSGDIILSDVAAPYSLPIGSLNLQSLVDLRRAMNNVFVTCLRTGRKHFQRLF
jgi:hypothetical protein